MSVLVIGGDNIVPIKSVLSSLGVENIKHWNARNKNSVTKKKIPQNVDCVVLLTNFLNHNAMYKFKNEAKKRSIPFICAKRNESSIFCEFCKFLNKDGECFLNS